MAYAVPAGYTLVKRTGERRAHLLAPTLRPTGAAVQCGAYQVDLDDGWQLLDGAQASRGVCADCRDFWKSKRKKAR